MAEIRKFKSRQVGAPPREPTPRRLAAIVAGDISGYSRLMQIDEEGTHNRVKRIERDSSNPASSNITAGWQNHRRRVHCDFR